MSGAVTAAPFGELTPLIAPRSIAVVGASDRDGNLGGLSVKFLQKFGYKSPVWPVNAGRDTVAGLRCYPTLADLPESPDLAILAVPADSVSPLIKECAGFGIPAAVAWAGGFAEGGPEGCVRQRELEAVCRETGVKLCGPNCIGIINTSIGMTASFSSLMTELDHFRPGYVSIVSQSGGIAVNAHARAQSLGLGFRVTISCGNEAALGIPDFMQALVEDEETRVIAVYTEGVGQPDKFVSALAAAKARRKPVVVLKGGASAESSRAALAHTGQLAGTDRTYDAIFREFAAIRVHSPEELLEVSLQLGSLPSTRLPKGNRVLIKTFGGGAGVIATDECVREGLTVPPLGAATRAALAPMISPLASSANPVDLTPGAMTNPKLRPNMPAVLKTLASAPETDVMLCFSSGFGQLAPELVQRYRTAMANADKPLLISWLSPPPGTVETLNVDGVLVFTDHSRVVRTAAHIVRYGEDMRRDIARSTTPVPAFPWYDFVSEHSQVISENVAARILEAAGLSVAKGRLARSAQEALACAAEVGFPVVMKGISPAVTHRAAAGLIALDLATPDAVNAAFGRLTARAAELDVTLEGVWVQHMFAGDRELLVTAFRDADFGVIVGCGIGGGMTEIIDDVAFTRAPIGETAALQLFGRLRTLIRFPNYLSAHQLPLAAQFLSRFSFLAASAPWPRFTFEVNPLKLSDRGAAAVDGLVLLDDGDGQRSAAEVHLRRGA
jgi:acyl-CoA synthetase (NDP forming)